MNEDRLVPFQVLGPPSGISPSPTRETPDKGDGYWFTQLTIKVGEVIVLRHYTYVDS